MPPDRTSLPTFAREWIGAMLSGPPGSPRKRSFPAAIYKVDRLGDFVLALSAIRLLLEHFGSKKTLLIVSELAAPIAAREFPDTPRIILPVDAPGAVRDLVGVWRHSRPQFAGLHCELRVCLAHQRNVYKSTSLTWLAAEREVKLTRATFPHHAEAPLCLELEAHRQLVSGALSRTVPPEEILPRFDHLAASAGRHLLVCPYSSQAEKNVPVRVLRDALQKWRGKSAGAIMLCVAPSQMAGAVEFQDACGSHGVDNIVISQPQTTDDFLAAIAQAGAVLTMDSAAAHIATALDKPTCVIASGPTWGLCVPWHRSARQTTLRFETSAPEISDAIAAALPGL